MELVQIFFNNRNTGTGTITIFGGTGTNFLEFFFYFFKFFSFLDPDPGGKINADPAGSGSATLLGTTFFYVHFYLILSAPPGSTQEGECEAKRCS